MSSFKSPAYTETATSRRTFVVIGFQACLVGTLIGRLMWLQGFSHQTLTAQAEGNRIQVIPILPRRGDITDRNAVTLATAHRDLQLYVIPERSKNIKESLNRLRSVINLDPEQIDRLSEQAKRSNRYLPFRIASHLDWETLSKLSIDRHTFPEIELSEGHIRYYPFGSLTSHSLGYVSTVSPKERETLRDPMLYQTDYQIGKTGIEKNYEKVLRGTGGSRSVEVDARGRYIQQINRIEAKSGKTLTLGLDIRVQEFLTEQFSQYRRAAGVVMDVNSGEVLAAVSKPSFDANKFSEGLEQEQWKLLSKHPDTPLTNKIISGQYAPGSTYKIVSLLAGLEAGLAQRHAISCKGAYKLGNHSFHCWKRGGHGKVDVQSGLRWSCDIWYYTLARLLGIDAMAKMSFKLGLGAPTGIEMAGELAGHVPTRAWREKQFGDPWQEGETLINAIGQGFVLTTPLQLAQMMARVASGRAVKAHMIKREKGMPGHETSPYQPLDLSLEHLRFVRQILYDVVNAKDGTGRSAKLKDPQFALAGKTGTAQVRRISKSERQSGVLKNETLDWRLRDHSLFVAFAPAFHPRWASAVVVEHSGSGSRVAAPITGRLFNYIQTLYSAEKQTPSR